jgi:hypothetical protein
MLQSKTLDGTKGFFSRFLQLKRLISIGKAQRLQPQEPQQERLLLA